MSDAWEFKHTDCDGKVVSVTFNGDTWFEALNVFEQFLRGCGFSVPEGEIKTPRNMQTVLDYEAVHPKALEELDNYPKKPDGEGWISNKGNDTIHCPIDLDADQEIEICYREGWGDTGTVGDWYWCWRETNNSGNDIVWFRVVN